MRRDSLVRCLRLSQFLAKLAADGQPIPNWQILAYRYGVSTRTIRRDVSALQRAGVPVPLCSDDRS